jgi:hypothetical protein
VKILCSYMAMSAPRAKGVTESTIMELVGLLPRKALCGPICLIWASEAPAFFSSASTS